MYKKTLTSKCTLFLRDLFKTISEFFIFGFINVKGRK